MHVDHRVRILFEEYLSAFSEVFLHIVKVEVTYLYVVSCIGVKAKIGLEFSRDARVELIEVSKGHVLGELCIIH